jgi:hypothetical protein
MEKFNGYIIMKQYSSGSKSDGLAAYLFVSPYKVFKLYRAEELPTADNFFNEFHLKSVTVSGVFHQRIRSIKVDSIEIANDPFLSNDLQSEEVKNEEE